ncbi:MAG: dephospho-CoA kinase [Clostridiales bacterium]|nr:dephospho-CoA kinase [Clostridiales bacterium]
MKIAIIGGIGSGKSRVLSLLANYGERVCDCDEIYNRICELPRYIEQIQNKFGAVKDGKIDKKSLGEIVFADREKLRELNSLAHPLVFEEIDKIYKKNDGKLFVEVSAFDIDMKNYFDEIIYVKSQKSTRIERVMSRNKCDEDYVLSVMSKQMSDEEMESVADFVIVNDGDIGSLESQVEWILQWLDK